MSDIHTPACKPGIAPDASPELALIARILAGERHLFHDLIRPTERQVYVMLFMMMRNQADAEDVAQEVMIKVYRNLAHFRGEARFSSWVLTIARHEGLSRLKRRKNRAEESFDPAGGEEHGDVTPAMLTDWREVPLEALERKELGQLIRNAIYQLPPIYCEVVQLRDVEELTIEETAQLLDITQGAVKVRLHRARLMLQKQLAPALQQYAPPKRRWMGWLR